MSEHVHDCTGSDMRCPCGYVFHVPPICVSVEVTRRRETLVEEGFNTDSLLTAARALERAAKKLRELA